MTRLRRADRRVSAGEPHLTRSRPIRMRRAGLLAVLLSLGLLTGSAPLVIGPPAPEPPSDPAAPALRLTLLRSMVGPVEQAVPPRFTLYGGGRVVAGDATRTRVFTLSPDQYRRVYRLAHSAGLARSRHLPEPGMTTDGTLLIADLWSGGRPHTTTAVSLGRGTETGQRRRLAEFCTAVQRLRPDLPLGLAFELR
ncbi:hypothetical protein AB0M02_33770 [Actinoplanes sp. NPDC051861]|uniref:hypothetical protein n=1 Tax=Actinoplanes sp. NPDC051861 TaxID=3155170 RepID=UPI003444B193